MIYTPELNDRLGAIATGSELPPKNLNTETASVRTVPPPLVSVTFTIFKSTTGPPHIQDQTRFFNRPPTRSRSLISPQPAHPPFELRPPGSTTISWPCHDRNTSLGCYISTLYTSERQASTSLTSLGSLPSGLASFSSRSSAMSYHTLGSSSTLEISSPRKISFQFQSEKNKMKIYYSISVIICVLHEFFACVSSNLFLKKKTFHMSHIYDFLCLYEQR